MFLVLKRHSSYTSGTQDTGFRRLALDKEGERTLIGKGFFKEPFVLDADGCVAVPDSPGLDIELDEEGLERIMARPWHVRRG